MMDNTPRTWLKMYLKYLAVEMTAFIYLAYLGIQVDDYTALLDLAGLFDYYIDTFCLGMLFLGIWLTYVMFVAYGLLYLEPFHAKGGEMVLVIMDVVEYLLFGADELD